MRNLFGINAVDIRNETEYVLCNIATPGNTFSSKQFELDDIRCRGYNNMQNE
jgi:hypothetical protein